MSTNTKRPSCRTELLSPVRIPKVADCLSRQFTAAEPMGVALGLSYEQFLPAAQAILEHACGEGLSVVAVDPDTDRIMGVVVAEDLHFALLPGAPSPADIYPGLEPIFALLEELTHAHFARLAPRAGEYVHLLMACTHPRAESSVTNRLLQAFILNCRERGYEHLVLEATGKASRKMRRIAGMESRGCVRYADFEWNGSKPFAAIRETDVCELLMQTVRRIVEVRCKAG